MLKMSMFGKIALVLLTSLAFLQPPIAQSTLPCCSHPGSHQAFLADGCCAAMGCCAISDGSASRPITLAPAAQQLSAFPAPCLVSLIDFPISPHQIRFATASPVAHSPTPLALLCTRLI